jgi:hypothetical protein
LLPACGYHATAAETLKQTYRAEALVATLAALRAAEENIIADFRMLVVMMGTP